MSCERFYTSIISIGCIALALAAALPAVADGDPTELNTAGKAEITLEINGNELRPDEQGAMTEDAVATVTADGDFLLPTYLLPGETASVERTTTVEKVYENQPATEVFEKTAIRETNITPQPVISNESETVVVNVPEKPTTQVTEIVQQAQTQTNKRVVAQTDELEALLKQTAPADDKVLLLGEGHRKKAEEAKSEPVKKKLLIPLAPVPVAEQAEPTVPMRERLVAPSIYADKMLDSLKAGEKVPFLMPHEIRITFYPKASAFSGQALKWVKAFAMAAIQDPRLVVEVRASCAEADLQAARLKLVKEALKGAGLSEHQIVVNYTNRPVDTMLLRAVPRSEITETVVTQKDQKLPKNMSRIQKW